MYDSIFERIVFIHETGFWFNYVENDNPLFWKQLKFVADKLVTKGVTGKHLLLIDEKTRSFSFRRAF